MINRAFNAITDRGFFELSDTIFHYTKYEILKDKLLPTNMFKLFSFQQANDPQEYNEKLRGVKGAELTQEQQEESFVLKSTINNNLLEPS